MGINNNAWNRIRYSLYAPVYNIIEGAFAASRRKSLDSLDLSTGQKVLIVGGGTGLDFPFIPEGCYALATDLTPAMVEKMRKKALTSAADIQVEVMDGHELTCPADEFDAVVLHLILAVIPDPLACIREVERVLKPGGKVAVFDKFIPSGTQPSTLRKAFNALTNLFFSDITRSIESIVEKSNLQIIQDTPANFNGNFRIIQLQKPN